MRLRFYQIYKCTCNTSLPGLAGYPTFNRSLGMAKKRPGNAGYSAWQAGQPLLRWSPHLSCKRKAEKVRIYMRRRVARLARQVT